jgi:uncharacterized protein (TIGR02678 family)
VSRTAAQLPEHDLEDFQRGARGLLATGLVTDTWPGPGLLPLVRRFESVLRAELSQVFGWALRIDARSARVIRSPLRPDARRGARLTERGSSNTNRAFRPRDYAMLCLVLAGLERQGTQTTIRQLVAAVERARSGREDLPVDFAAPADRRCFVTAVAWLVHLGVLVESADSDTFRFIDDGEADALYSVDHDLARRLLGPLPTMLDPAAGIEALGADDGEGENPARQRLARRLLEQPAVYYAELDDAERQVLTDRRVELSGRLERLTGCQVETRGEGLALIDPDARVRLGAQPGFPGTGNVGNIAAAYAGALLAVSDELAVTPSGRTDDDSTADNAGGGAPTRSSPAAPSLPVGRRIPAAAASRAWASVLSAHGSGLSSRWAADPGELRREATSVLIDLGLVMVDPTALASAAQPVAVHAGGGATHDSVGVALDGDGPPPDDPLTQNPSPGARSADAASGVGVDLILRPLAGRFDYPDLPEGPLLEETP